MKKHIKSNTYYMKNNKETYDFVINTDGKALGCVNEGGSHDIVVG